MPGGILGGISTGQDIVVRVGVQADQLDPDARAEPSISTAQETEIMTKGRHDPCVGLRGTPVAEAMMACVLADHWLRHKAQCL
jgi:chorismate synthase